MRRRRAVQSGSLTSLLDVLFILVFASLIHGASLEAREREREAAQAEAERARLAAEEAARRAAEAERQQAAEGAARAAAPAPGSPEQLRRDALAELSAGLARRDALVVRISADGRLRAIERGGPEGPRVEAVGVELVERVADRDVGLRYLGDRDPERRVCRIVGDRLGLPHLADHLIIVAPDAPLAQLSVALARGLRRDVERCAVDQRGAAVLIDPAGGGGSAAGRTGGSRGAGGNR